MKIRCARLLAVYAILLLPHLAQANSGDFSGGVAIGTSYAGANTAPTNGLIVQGNVGIGTTAPTAGAALDLSKNTNSMLLPVGTTGQRPATGVNGMMRYNSTTPAVEGYINNAWSPLSTSSSGYIKTIKTQVFTSTGTYTPSTGMVYASTECWGGGGGGGSGFSGGAGGAGGVTGTGDITLSGNNGYHNVGYGAAIIGAGGATSIGQGGPYAWSYGSSVTGFNSEGYGAGGGGGTVSGNNGNVAGGNGSAGFVRITEYISQ